MTTNNVYYFLVVQKCKRDHTGSKATRIYVPPHNSIVLVGNIIDSLSITSLYITHQPIITGIYNMALSSIDL